MTSLPLSPSLSWRVSARTASFSERSTATRTHVSRALGPPAYVKHYDSQLSHLDNWLAIIALVGKVASRSSANGVLDNVSVIQESFRILRVQLATALTEEYAREYEMVLGGRASIAVDMLVRNLFERSADIGFLSTDVAICAYMESNGEEGEIQQHLARYIAKYSVYDDVMLFNMDGAFLTSLKYPEGDAPRDDALGQALAQLNSGYIEYFSPTPLVPHRPQAHLFISTVYQAQSNTCLGYLALSFNLDEEAKRIFAELGDGAFELALLDNNGQVVASSLAQLAVHDSLRHVGVQGVNVVELNGKTYACRQVSGSTYQGYAGLGWRYLALTELSADTLVERNAMQSPSEVDVVKGQLNSIRYQASAIAQQLNLAVINGQIISVRDKAVELVPVLHQIREIGNLTDQLFEGSISQLKHGMSLTAIADATMRAYSMVSIMDRNLYERANDVRWWALDGRIRQQLVAASKGCEPARAALSHVIQSINQLYTVYTNIILFDREGVVVAVSNEASKALIGSGVPESLPLNGCLNIRSDQGYVVSPFTESELYSHQPTYLYCAPVVDVESNVTVGGIATVFDATPEFRQILADNLPIISATELLAPFALFIDAEGQVISATIPNLCLSTLLAGCYEEVLGLRDGERLYKQIEYAGHRYLAAMVASTGYREYKREDNYRNDVIAIACLPIV